MNPLAAVGLRPVRQKFHRRHCPRPHQASKGSDASTEDYRTFQNSSPNLDRFLTKGCGRLPTLWKRFHEPDGLVLRRVDLSRQIGNGPQARRNAAPFPFALLNMLSPTVSPQSDEASSNSGDSFSPAHLPLDHPASSLEAAVEQLRCRPEEELRRARKHHRRALKALQDGAYEALSAETRDQLVHQFRSGLRALNQALDEAGTPAPEEDASAPSSTSLGDVLTGLW